MIKYLHLLSSHPLCQWPDVAGNQGVRLIWGRTFWLGAVQEKMNCVEGWRAPSHWICWRVWIANWWIDKVLLDLVVCESTGGWSTGGGGNSRWTSLLLWPVMRIMRRPDQGKGDGLLYLRWITNKDLLYSTWNCAQWCASLDGRGFGGRMDTCICMVESPHCSLETTTI